MCLQWPSAGTNAIMALSMQMRCKTQHDHRLDSLSQSRKGLFLLDIVIEIIVLMQSSDIYCRVVVIVCARTT